MAVANAMTATGAAKARNKARKVIADRFLTMPMIAHIRPIHHIAVATINTVHPVYGGGSNSGYGKLYAKKDKMPPAGMLITVRIIDTTGNSRGLGDSRIGS